MKTRAYLFVLTVVALAGAVPASAHDGGISGYSGNPATGAKSCSSCHSGGTKPSVTLSGPASVSAGSVNSYTLLISGGQKAFGGLDVSAAGGILAAGGADTKILNGEVVQTSGKSADSSGNVSFSFKWTAPAAAGTATLYGAGLSTNGSGTSGDAVALASLAIAVVAPAPSPTPTPTPTPTTPVNLAPTANAGGPYTGTVGLAVQFDGSKSTDADGSIASYDWDFGDGAMGTGATPTHVYGSPGVRTVKLVVKDNLGATAQSSASVTVVDPVPLSLSASLSAPAKVRLRKGLDKAINIVLSGTLAGAQAGANLCGTAYLDKNGASYLSQPVCIQAAADGSGSASISFAASVGVADATAAVQWSGSISLSGVVSGQASASTLVISRR